MSDHIRAASSPSRHGSEHGWQHAVTPQQRNRILVATWMFTLCFMILVMVMLGGATRLTGSGLSIMEWAPLMGTLPPTSQVEWERLYALYQKIPQYALVNHGFGLDGFKHIFWLEWTHRLWGRLIGLVLLLPLIFLVVTRRIERSLIPRLILIFVLGGLQGAVGWFMVASGFFPDSTAVSPYRLVIHLSFALLLYSALLWTALSVLNPEPRPLSGTVGLRRMSAVTLVLVCITIIAGGFVAGIHAGLDYNTFPLMDGRLVPEGYGEGHRAMFENIPTVQFDHRLLATLTALTALLTGLIGFRRGGNARRAVLPLMVAVILQYALGIATLLSVVAVPVAVVHQGMAVLLLTAAIVTLHSLRGAGRTASINAPASSH
ncbi:COX15/CtaA family protein [Granulibacter bethesdensis]|uniref:COX15/CtaA family protein n=1 Tax=Granulibacter bethesdensis TaxID=364410 RepID=UPI0003F1F7BD|nr:COX15/CtaA family protein [Granulibacter bethesdensis]AHJ65328.1 Heme O monooxygenase (ferredoxin) [Granulibacter bethesdensis CGDNIH4]